MEDGLVPVSFTMKQFIHFSLNPCCSGQWSRTATGEITFAESDVSLNPCCSGQWSRTGILLKLLKKQEIVLILVVVDNGLVLAVKAGKKSLPSLNPCCSGQWSRTHTRLNTIKLAVLILVVVDNGLVQASFTNLKQ